jgi:protein-L-isoaspartate O-methyltransferase
MAKKSHRKNTGDWISEGAESMPAAYHNGFRIGVGAEDVSTVENYLRDEWQIVFVEGSDPNDFILDGLPRQTAEAFRRVQEIRVECNRTGRTIPADVEQEFYNLICDKALLGQVHSRKRTLILDELCAALAISRSLPSGSAILEVGSHAGYMGLFLARDTGHRVVCEDGADEAIAVAQDHGCGMPNFEARVRDYTMWQGDAEMFDMVIACDAATRSGNPKLIDYCSKHVREGGLLILVGAFCGPVADRVATRKSLSAAGFQLLDVDSVGGLNSSGPGGEFEGTPLLLLQKGGPHTFPINFCDLASRHWPGFSAYANTPDVPAARKTQAWYNALIET